MNKRTKLLSIITFALALILVLGSCAAKSDVDFLKEKTIEKLEDVLEEIEENSNTQPADLSSAKGSMKLELGESGADILKNFIEFDMEWFKNLTIDFEAHADKGNTLVDTEISLNDKEIISGSALIDAVGQKAYLKVPLINDKEYIAFPINQATEEGAEMPAFNNVKIELDDEVINKLVLRYAKTLINKINEVEKEDATLTVEDFTLKCSKYTARIPSEDVKQAVLEIFNDLEKNKDVEAVVKELAKNSEQTPEEFYKEFVDSIKEAKDEIAKEEATNEQLIYTAYMNKNDFLSVELSAGNTSFLVSSFEKGKDFAVEMQLKSEEQTMGFSGGGTKEKDTVSGDFVLNYLGMDALNIKLNNINTKSEKDKASGEVVIAPTQALAQMVGPMLPEEYASMIPNLSIFFGIDEEADGFRLTVYNGEASLASIIINAEKAESKKVTLPEKAVDGTNETELQEWLQDMNIFGLLGNISNAGFPIQSLIG